MGLRRASSAELPLPLGSQLSIADGSLSSLAFSWLSGRVVVLFRYIFGNLSSLTHSLGSFLRIARIWKRRHKRKEVTMAVQLQTNQLSCLSVREHNAKEAYARQQHQICRWSSRGFRHARHQIAHRSKKSYNETKDIRNDG